MFDYRNVFSIVLAACYVQLATAQETYVPKLIIKNMTGAVLTISNAGGYLDLELRDGGLVHDKTFISGDVICQPGATLIFEFVPGKLQCTDTYFLSPEVYQKWASGKIRLWGGIMLFWSVKPIVSAQMMQQAIETQKDVLVHIKREKWFKSVYNLRKTSRHYRISHIELVDGAN